MLKKWSFKYLRVLPFLAVALVVLQLVLSNELAAVGGKVGQFDSQISALQEENEQLAVQVASASSLLSIAAKASEFGLRETVSTYNLSVNQYPVAFKQSGP